MPPTAAAERPGRRKLCDDHSETGAIAMHLADRYPGRDPERALAPAVGTPERARYYQWMFFMANIVQPAYRAWFYPTEPAGAENVEATKRQARVRRWARKMPRPIETWPALAAYARRMKSLPSFNEVYAREGLTDWT